jgi:hypothetical protein
MWYVTPSAYLKKEISTSIIQYGNGHDLSMGVLELGYLGSRSTKGCELYRERVK